MCSYTTSGVKSQLQAFTSICTHSNSKSAFLQGNQQLFLDTTTHTTACIHLENMYVYGCICSCDYFGNTCLVTYEATCAHMLYRVHMPQCVPDAMPQHRYLRRKTTGSGSLEAFRSLIGCLCRCLPRVCLGRRMKSQRTRCALL